MTKCSRCGRSGHNRRACPTGKRKAPTGAGAGEDAPSAGDRNAKRPCSGGGGRAEAAAALKGEEAPEEDDRLPPSGRLAFVNAVQPEFARDFLLPCLSDDVDALLALVHTCASLRDLVAGQLTRLDCTKRERRRFTDDVVFDRNLCFLGANLLELDVSQVGNLYGDDRSLTDAGVCEIANRCPNLRRFVARRRPFIQDSVKTLAYRCSRLEEVDLAPGNLAPGIPAHPFQNVTNGSISVLARR